MAEDAPSHTRDRIRLLETQADQDLIAFAVGGQGAHFVQIGTLADVKRQWPSNRAHAGTACAIRIAITTASIVR
jgi:hypothetical protein